MEVMKVRKVVKDMSLRKAQSQRLHSRSRLTFITCITFLTDTCAV
jgi:hypothetical protein